MKHINKIVTAVSTALVLPVTALAAENPFQRAQNLAGQVGNTAYGGQPQDLTKMVGNIINVVLGFLGIVFLGLLLYAGFLWMTAAGEEEKTKKAKNIIYQAIIGLIVIVAAFAISNFVLGSLLNVTQAA